MQGGMSPRENTTAQYKKQLSKGVPMQPGKVLDDYDDEDDMYEEEDTDEQTPNYTPQQSKTEKMNYENAKKQTMSARKRKCPNSGVSFSQAN